MLGYWAAFRHGRVLGYWPAFRHGRVLGYWAAFRHGRVLGYWAAFRHGRVLGYWPAFRHRRVLGCADVGLADRDRRALAGPVIAGPREILIRPVIAERQETVVFVQVIRVDQASSPPGFYLGHRRRERRLLIPVIPGNGRRHACGHLRACFRRGPRQGAQLGLSVRQRLMRQVPGVETAPGLGLRSALSRVPELALSGVLGLGLTGVPGLALTRLLGLALTGLLGLGLTRLLGAGSRRRAGAGGLRPAALAVGTARGARRHPAVRSHSGAAQQAGPQP